MSELDRFKRLAKSLIPRFPKGNERNYSLEDAQMMLNDLGMQMSPAVLAYLIDSDEILDDFVNSIYHLETKLKKRIITDDTRIDPELDPKVYVVDGTVAFTIVRRGGELIFAEYELPKGME